MGEVGEGEGEGEVVGHILGAEVDMEGTSSMGTVGTKEGEGAEGGMEGEAGIITILHISHTSKNTKYHLSVVFIYKLSISQLQSGELSGECGS